MEKLFAIFVFALLFVFIALIFPTLQTYVTNSNVTGPVAPLIDNFPYVFLAITVPCLILIVWRRK